MSISDCQLIDLPKITDLRGNLTFLEGGNHVPFDIARVFYLYDVPADLERGGHALRTCEQFLVALSGSFNVILKDGSEIKRIRLDRPNSGLYLPPLVWREMDNFSSDAVCLVFASERYNENAYLRNYDDFLAYRPI